MPVRKRRRNFSASELGRLAGRKLAAMLAKINPATHSNRRKFEGGASIVDDSLTCFLSPPASQLEADQSAHRPMHESHLSARPLLPHARVRPGGSPCAGSIPARAGNGSENAGGRSFVPRALAGRSGCSSPSRSAILGFWGRSIARLLMDFLSIPGGG